MNKADAEERTGRAFLAGENHACVALHWHPEMHFHPPQTPLDRDAARRQQNHPAPAIGARIVSGPRLDLV